MIYLKLFQITVLFANNKRKIYICLLQKELQGKRIIHDADIIFEVICPQKTSTNKCPEG